MSDPTQEIQNEALTAATAMSAAALKAGDAGAVGAVAAIVNEAFETAAPAWSQALEKLQRLAAHLESET